MATGYSLPNLRDTGSVGSFKQICTDRSSRTTLATGYSMAAAAGLVGGGGGYSAEVLADSPVGYWPLESDFNDSSGSGNNLTSNGSPTASTAVTGFPNDLGTRLETADYFTMGSYISALGIQGDLTLEFWMRADNVSNNQYIIDHQGNTSAEENDRLYAVTLGESASYLRARHQYGGNLSQFYDFVSTNTASTVYHMVVTRDSATKTYELFKDGVSVDSGTYANNPTGGQGASAQLAIGALYYGANSFVGELAHVAVYNTKLSPARISAHYAAGTA